MKDGGELGNKWNSRWAVGVSGGGPASVPKKFCDLVMKGED